MSGKLRTVPAMSLALIALTAFAWPDDGAYRLVPEDVVAIQVLYHPELSVAEATIAPDGTVNYPIAGEVRAQGRTLVELSEIITQALRGELRDPKVSVRLVRRYLAPVYVLGAVQTPGAVQVIEPVTVAEAIALAGGVSPTAAPRWGTVIRADGSQSQVDVMAALRGEAGPGPVLQPGDTLVVSAQFLVSVVGEVRAPGRYPAEGGDRVADALASAGGLANTADGSAARLIRADASSLPVDLDAIIADASVADNQPLQPGDLLVVPTLEQRVTVVGAVKMPGKYDFDEGDRVSDALAQARGPLDDARLAEAVLVRRDGSSAPVDFEAIVQDADQQGNLPLANGDTLIVPRWADQVAVMGMVNRPGVLPLTEDMTVMSAIAAAGGWTREGATPGRTLLWRQSGEGPAMVEVDAAAIMRGDPAAHDLPLQPGDIVYVPAKTGLSRDEISRLLIGVSALLRLVF
ncbi:MAG TPA: SLBB domain-containing protein [Armatimonadota bacterium]|nr:SLBB domain-containing protein [Armatimonadota bacterium]